MREGQFREDLYYRLNVITLTLPPLAQRREDVAPMASQFLQSLAAKYGKTVRGFAPDALEALTTAAWPGNVRQLYNVVEHVARWPPRRWCPCRWCSARCACRRWRC
jgi:two-component system response regulator GlrR